MLDKFAKPGWLASFTNKISTLQAKRFNSGTSVWKRTPTPSEQEPFAGGDGKQENSPETTGKRQKGNPKTKNNQENENNY